MGGNLQVESKPGEGSRFSFAIPFVHAEPAPEHSESAKQEPGQYDMKVLVVEDNQTNQLLVKSMLKKVGITCQMANNGQEAVDSISSQHFDLVFMDCQMPIMDGYTATAAIRQDLGLVDLPIVANDRKRARG